MATHSSILAWEIPWTEEPGKLYSPWGHKEWDVHNLVTKQQQQSWPGLMRGTLHPPCPRPRVFLFNRSPLPGNPRLQPSFKSLSTLYHCTHLEQKGACMLSCFSPVHSLRLHGLLVHQTPLSMEFLKQEHWSGLSFPSPGDLPSLGIRAASLISLALAVRFFFFFIYFFLVGG